MLWVLAILAVTVAAISLIADYKWRRWMAERKAERERDQQS